MLAEDEPTPGHHETSGDLGRFLGESPSKNTRPGFYPQTMSLNRQVAVSPREPLTSRRARARLPDHSQRFHEEEE